MQVPEDRLWTADDVARFCRVKRSVVMHWIRTTDIPFMKLGKSVRFDSGQIKEWVLCHSNFCSAFGKLRFVNLKSDKV